MSPEPNSPRYHFSQAGKTLDHVDAHVQVICRIRPLSPQEEESGDTSVVNVLDDHTVSVNNKGNEQRFQFDRACGPETTQQAFYDIVTEEMLRNFFLGFNGTILAYGQTGAGKSHTMFGSSSDQGIIPRISHSIFSHITEGPSDVEYTVSISLMEIYKEQIKDLLKPGNKGKECTVHEDKVNGVFVKGLSHAFVSSANEMNEVVHQGSKRRTVSSTLMNVESSRSHSLIQIVLSQKNIDKGSITKSTLFLVDLAGSEKVDKTGALGLSLEEAKKINLSLSVLSLVINSLSDSKLTHVPYRDSKLTRILQESLGGNSRTTLITNCSPALSCVLETISTLRFGNRAKKIKNSLHVNTELSVDQLKARVAFLERLNKGLEAELKQNSANSTLLSPSCTNRIRLPHEKLLLFKEELERKDTRISELEKEVLELKMSQLKELHSEDLKLFKLESALRKLSDKLSDIELINDSLRKHLLISEKIIESRESKINKLRVLLEEQQAQVKKESIQFESKLDALRNKLETKWMMESGSGPDDASFEANTSNTLGSFFGNSGIAEQILDNSSVHSDPREPGEDFNTLIDSPLGGKSSISPGSPKLGLNLRIVKPLRGGHPEENSTDRYGSP